MFFMQVTAQMSSETSECLEANAGFLMLGRWQKHRLRTYSLHSI